MNHKSLFLDVSIVHPLISSHLSLAKKGPLKCTEKVETAKLIEYSDQQATAATFIPFIIESFGGFTQTETKLINLIARFSRSSSNNSLSFSETEVLADNRHCQPNKTITFNSFLILFSGGNCLINLMMRIHSTFDFFFFLYNANIRCLL